MKSELAEVVMAKCGQEDKLTDRSELLVKVRKAATFSFQPPTVVALEA